ncbi:MAG: NACHT domain-containing protein [Caulobacter sp.]|nr:NACHT domain-containing protein [Caulobacter sp.]
MASDRDENEKFEDDVRQLARAIFSDADSVSREKIDGRERDCIVRNGDDVYLIEATTSRRQDKVENDAAKIVLLRETILKESPNALVRGIIVTREEPTAEQSEYLRKKKSFVKIESLAKFSARIINGREYLRLRDDYRFGSVADPSSGHPTLSFEEYIDVSYRLLGTENSVSIGDLSEAALKSTCRAILFGEFGVGKSMALREAYRRLSKAYRTNGTTRVPIFLNLRDHAGQTPVEALRRHADNIGYERPTDLVRAWRAGHVCLLLDGFDEIGNPGWGQSYRQLRAYRFRAVELVRKFIAESPRDTSILISGRENFFDSLDEMGSALDPNDSCKRIQVSEFDDKAIAKLLHRVGFTSDVPAWLPARPLLISYFAFRVGGGDAVVAERLATPERGWDLFIDQVCRREAEQYPMIEPQVVRAFLERLATRARRSPDGLGSFDPAEIAQVFQSVAGFSPDDVSQSLLLRVLALRTLDPRTGARSFIDVEFAGALMAGDALRFLINPYDQELQEEFRNSGPSPLITSSMVAERSADAGLNSAHFKAALIEARKSDLPMASRDVLLANLTLNYAPPFDLSYEGVDFGNLHIKSDYGNMSYLQFSNCLFQKLTLDDDVDTLSIPIFLYCLLINIESSKSEPDIRKIFSGSDIGHIYSFGLTTDRLLQMGVPQSIRVLMTILKKIFVQSGSGRMRSALERGLGQEGRSFVEPVVRILVQHDMISRVRLRGSDIFMPSRKASSRVHAILANPVGHDPILKACREL